MGPLARRVLQDEILEGWRAGSRAWKVAMMQRAEEVLDAASAAVEEAHTKAVTRAMDDVLAEREELRSLRVANMSARADAIRNASQRRAQEDERRNQALARRARENKQRVELETLKAHVLTMWNRVGTPSEEREAWLVHFEDAIRGDHDGDGDGDDANGAEKPTALHHAQKRVVAVYRRAIAAGEKILQEQQKAREAVQQGQFQQFFIAPLSSGLNTGTHTLHEDKIMAAGVEA